VWLRKLGMNPCMDSCQLNPFCPGLGGLAHAMTQVILRWGVHAPDGALGKLEKPHSWGFSGTFIAGDP